MGGAPKQFARLRRSPLPVRWPVSEIAAPSQGHGSAMKPLRFGDAGRTPGIEKRRPRAAPSHPVPRDRRHCMDRAPCAVCSPWACSLKLGG
jgi:hypothetical protein